MKLSVVLLLVSPALTSARRLDINHNSEQSNVSFLNSDRDGSPETTPQGSMLTDGPPPTQTSSLMSDDGSNLEWVTWNNSLPNDAVSIYNNHFDRIDYICKYLCEAGFYTPSMGPYCHYPTAKKTYSGSPFEILVNKNNFEVLEWKEDSHGSVSQNSVRICPNIYVGKNKYGLGKVSTKDKVFYLPWEGSVYEYSYYQVLTINEDIVNQQVYDVRYNTDEAKIFHYPPQIVQKTAISNYECRSVVKTDSLSKTYQVEHRWDITFSVQVGVQMKFTASVPFIASDSMEFSTEVTFQYSKGNTVTDAITDAVSVEITAPPNHSCMVNMLQYKYKVDIPFTARVSRTYATGEIHTTSITGTYDSVQVGEVRAVADRCQLLDDSKPCA